LEEGVGRGGRWFDEGPHGIPICADTGAWFYCSRAEAHLCLMGYRRTGVGANEYRGLGDGR
jgi:hypothetical protein